jgi:superoxide dismutase, Fe-Mn family
MLCKLPDLNFAKNALVPYISEETIEFHYGRHHQAYVENLNKLVVGTEFERKTLPDIINTATGPVFNNAAQVWNHNFYWDCLKPGDKKKLPEELQQKICSAFNDFEKFKEDFTKEALGLFGSGWVWLVKDSNNDLLIVTTSNANNPLISGQIPLLTCDVWEHAYYIDCRNARAKYLDAFWNIVNWDFVNQNLNQGV